MNYITSTFRLPEELYEKIRMEAFNKRVSIAEIMRQACEEYFEKELKVQGDIDGKRSNTVCKE